MPHVYFWSNTSHPYTNWRHHSPAIAATTTSRLSFGFQRPHCPDFELFWSAAAAAAGLGCLSRRVCAVKPKDVVNVFGRCRPVKTRRRLRVEPLQMKQMRIIFFMDGEYLDQHNYQIKTFIFQSHNNTNRPLHSKDFVYLSDIIKLLNNKEMKWMNRESRIQT